MLADLHMTAPLPHNLVILPTHRSATSGGLALSSRNAYLSPSELAFSTVLITALRAASDVWTAQRGADGAGAVVVQDVLQAARAVVAEMEPVADKEGVLVKGMYFQLNDPEQLWDLESTGEVAPGKGAVLSGAVMLGRTRLIDNVVFEYKLN